jgi:hypothetical protein
MRGSAFEAQRDWDPGSTFGVSDSGAQFDSGRGEIHFDPLKCQAAKENDAGEDPGGKTSDIAG